MKNNKKLKARIYIDGANMFYAQIALGWFIDFKKLKGLFEKEWDVIGIRYYTGVKIDDKKIASFLRYLDNIGIEPVTKPLKQIKNKGQVLFKSNFDVEMTMDMLLERPSYDLCILLSGDSDFHALVKKIRDFGKQVMVYSTRRMISWELKLAVNKYFFLEDLKNEIKKTSARRWSRVKLPK